jgi:hypothetical protein
MRWHTAFALVCLLIYSAMPVYAQDNILIAEDYFVEAEVNNATPFVGEQVIYSFRFFTAVPFQEAPSYSPPSFEGFWRTDMGPSRSYPAQAYGRFYTVTQLDMAIYPTYAGDLSIESATLTLPTTVFQASEVLSTMPIRLQVRPVPDGAPENFRGAVGQFSMTASLNRQIVSQGEPITLQVTVIGTGNVEQLAAPELALMDQWRGYANPSRYQKTVREGVLVGERVFEWLLTPLAAGSISLPQVTLAYFDPASLSYRTASTGSVVLDVLPVEDEIELIQLDDREIENLPLKSISTPALPGESLLTVVLFWLLWVTPPALLGLTWWWSRQQALILPYQTDKRSSRALQDALRRLRTAQRISPGRGYSFASQAIITYFSIKLNVAPSALTQTDIVLAMRRHGIRLEMERHIIDCLEELDSAQYAPDTTTDLNSLISRAIKVLNAIDASWKR